MTEITKPILLDETGQLIVEKLSSLVAQKQGSYESAQKAAADAESAKTKSDQAIEKAEEVYTELGKKENLSNKTTTLNSSSTDTQYPSAKAVYNSIDSLAGSILKVEFVESI